MKEIKEQKENAETRQVIKNVEKSKGKKATTQPRDYVYQMFRQPYI